MHSLNEPADEDEEEWIQGVVEEEEEEEEESQASIPEMWYTAALQKQRSAAVQADCNRSELEEGEERALMLEDAASIESFVGRVSKDYQGEGGGEERRGKRMAGESGCPTSAAFRSTFPFLSHENRPVGCAPH